MRASELLTRNIYIRLAEDGSGFHWSIKYGPVQLISGQVPATDDEGTPEHGPVLRGEPDERRDAR